MRIPHFAVGTYFNLSNNSRTNLHSLSKSGLGTIGGYFIYSDIDGVRDSTINDIEGSNLLSGSHSFEPFSHIKSSAEMVRYLLGNLK